MDNDLKHEPSSTGDVRPPRPILFVITDLDPGGAEKCCVQLATGLDRRRWRPAVCALKSPGRLADSLRAAGVPVFSLHAESLRDAPRAIWRLIRLMARLRPALVHTLLFHANVLGRVAALACGVPRVVSSIRVAERRYRYHWVLETLTHRLAHQIVCVSEAVKQFTREHSYVPESRLQVIANGVAVDLTTPPCGVERVRLGLPDDVLAAYVGRLDDQKAVDVLLRALAAARATAPRLRLVIAGTGPRESALRQLAIELGLEAQVRFLGWCGDVPGLLDAVDFLVLPSRWEGMPNVVLEAMAAERAVVATRTEGTTELVRDGESGRLVPVDDVAALAGALVELATDGALRARYGRRGREIVERQYTVAKMVRRHERLYEWLAAAGDRIGACTSFSRDG